MNKNNKYKAKKRQSQKREEFKNQSKGDKSVVPPRRGCGKNYKTSSILKTRNSTAGDFGKLAYADSEGGGVFMNHPL